MMMKKLLLLILISGAFKPVMNAMCIETNDGVTINVEEPLMCESLTIANLNDNIRELHRLDNQDDDLDETTLLPLTEQTFRYIYLYLSHIHVINKQILSAEEREEAKQKLQEHLKRHTLEELLLILQGADYLNIPVLIEQALKVLVFKLSILETKEPQWKHIFQNLPCALRGLHVCNPQQIYPFISRILCHVQPLHLGVNNENFFISLPTCYKGMPSDTCTWLEEGSDMCHGLETDVAMWRRKRNMEDSRCGNDFSCKENIMRLLDERLKELSNLGRYMPEGINERLGMLQWIILSSENKTAICLGSVDKV